MDFLKNGPNPEEFSWQKVHKVGSRLRRGEPYDEEVLNRFLEHQAILCDCLLEVAAETVNLLPLNLRAGSIRPDSGEYVLAARVKTAGTLVEKLRRMPTYPLENIWDVSGLRLDCDLTLTEQTKIAQLFKDAFLRAGATKVHASDMRDQAHSGYRAIHLHLVTPAGRAEFQIRTAMQAQWANLYEVAADIYGREIRYLEFGEKPSENALDEIEILHEASRVIHETEKVVDEVFPPFQTRGGGDHSYVMLRDLRRDVYGILEERLAELKAVRAEITQKGK